MRHARNAPLPSAPKVFALFDEDETGKISFRNLKRIAQDQGSGSVWRL